MQTYVTVDIVNPLMEVQGKIQIPTYLFTMVEAISMKDIQIPDAHGVPFSITPDRGSVVCTPVHIFP